ncbi:MAG: hypothetical protein KC488_15380, partial [Candidatus Cloacimonetes bacterium]|nr:hypothetical protein [Candidatus Cloacimonadota bacterium]
MRRYIEITSDAFTWNGNTGLVNNHTYYFAVSAYSYDPNAVPNNLESAKVVVAVTPNAGPNGTDWNTAFVDSVVHSAGSSDGTVELDLIDEAQLMTASYAVSYYDTSWVEGELPDTATVVQTWWRVMDTTHNVQKAHGVAQADTDYPDFAHHVTGAPLVDGTLVKPLGPPLQGNSYGWTANDPDNSGRWLTGVAGGLELFFGGLGLGVNFFGSTLAPSDYTAVDVVLTADQNEWSNCQVYRRDMGYAANGIGTFPGKAFDMSDPANPRRLNICFVENDDPNDPSNTADGTWNPNGSSLGGREYLFIMDSDYNGGVDYDDDNWGPGADVQWAAWILLRSSQTGDCADPNDATGGCFESLLAARPATFSMVPNYVNTTNDVFTWSTTATTAHMSSKTLDAVRAVPNPYYGRSAYETKADVKVVKFTNLPA